MSVREVETSPPLLARKGAAAPAGSRSAGGKAAKPDAVSAIPAGDTGKPATAKSKTEAAPAASLLPFDLLRQRFRPGDSEDLAADEPDLSAADVAPDRPAPPILVAEPARTLRADVSVPAPKPGAAPAPTPSPEWRVGLAPKAPPPRAASGGWLLPVGALAAAVAALVVGWTLANRAPDATPGADAVAMTETATSPEVAPPASPPAAPSEPAPVDVATPPAAAPQQAQLPAPELSASEPSMPQQAESTVTEPVAADAPPAAPLSAEPQIAAPVAAPEPAASPEPVPPAPATPAPAAIAPATVAIKPTVDVVRLEPNGEAVIAGRAAPGGELIILDNGKPIGTATADAFGEWVFVPEGTLPSGAHEFGLVPKTVEQTVLMPAPAKPALPPAPGAAPAADPTVESIAAEPQGAEPAAVEPSAAAESGTATGSAPVPVRRPESTVAGVAAADTQVADTQVAGSHGDSPAGAAAVTADFVVQLASVKSRTGAEAEWRKLQQRFPDILGPMAPSLDEVKLAENGTFFRIRTGAFASQAEAADLCARLAAGNQDCLVVRTSTGN